MSITEYSPIQKAHLFGRVYVNSSMGTKAAPDTQDSSFNTVLTKEAPPVKIEEVSDIDVELSIQSDESRRLDYFDPVVRRSLSSGVMPDWFCNVAFGGSYQNDEFATIVGGYFEEVKKEFGCDEKSYVPYMYGLPEYDKGIVEQMKASFYEKVKNDPRAESLAGELGVLWPPERNTTAFSWTRKISVMDRPFA